MLKFNPEEAARLAYKLTKANLKGAEDFIEAEEAADFMREIYAYLIGEECKCSKNENEYADCGEEAECCEKEPEICTNDPKDCKEEPEALTQKEG
jgi:hypothetical protein